jgi:hypothetical protein
MTDSLRPTRWREVVPEGNCRHWQIWAPGYAVFGVVTETSRPNKWYWEARVMNTCRVDGQRQHGYVTTFEAAKRVVESLLVHTETLSLNDCSPPVDSWEAAIIRDTLLHRAYFRLPEEE